jgi:hypothetical protein
MHKTDVAWLAGLLEGEGSFGRKNGVPDVNLGMMDRDIVDRAGALLGLRTYSDKTPAGKPFWRLRTSGRYAAHLMRLFRPFLGQRRQGQIDTALADWTGGYLSAPFRRRLPQSEVLLVHQLVGMGLNYSQVSRQMRRDQSTVSRIARGRTHANKL